MKNKIIICLALMLTVSLANAQKETKKMQKETMVEITTDFGTMTIKLYNETPQHRDNFIKLAKEGFYNGKTHHRQSQYNLLSTFPRTGTGYHANHGGCLQGNIWQQENVTHPQGSQEIHGKMPRWSFFRNFHGQRRSQRFFHKCST